MRTIHLAVALTVAFLLNFNYPARAADASGGTGKIRVLVVTGGHDFEKEPFFQVFKDNPEIEYQAVEQPAAQESFKVDAAKNYDVLVFYDMHQEITDEGKSNLLARLKDGKGLVVLHHAIADYQTWPEYAKIIGAKYYLAPTVVDGVAKKRSAYKHGMHFTLHVVDPNNPVTKGMKDYEILDETYKWFDVANDVHPLLTTEEPESNHVVAWAKTYSNARVVYMQSGHDHFAYENPNFQKVLKQAIEWTARRN